MVTTRRYDQNYDNCTPILYIYYILFVFFSSCPFNSSQLNTVFLPHFSHFFPHFPQNNVFFSYIHQQLSLYRLAIIWSLLFLAIRHNRTTEWFTKPLTSFVHTIPLIFYLTLNIHDCNLLIMHKILFPQRNTTYYMSYNNLLRFIFLIQINRLRQITYIQNH